MLQPIDFGEARSLDFRGSPHYRGSTLGSTMTSVLILAFYRVNPKDNARLVRGVDAGTIEE